MTEFWKIILESNTFNFVILVAIFWVIAVKINLPDMIEKVRLNVAAAIEGAKLDLKNAQNNLKSAKQAAKDAAAEADEKIKLAKENAEGLSRDIIDSAKTQVEKIEANVLRVVDSEEKKIYAKLTRETMRDAIDIARQNIIDRLKSDKELQHRLISENIKELDGMTL